MHKILAFDISDDKVRRKATKLLLSKGIRIQESVFILSLKPSEYDKFVKKLKEIIGDRGIFHIFHLCHACERKSLAINVKYDFYVID